MVKQEPEEEQPFRSTQDNAAAILPVEKPSDAASRSTDTDEGNEESFVSDPRFNPPPPSPWKRVAVIFLIVLLLFCGFQFRGTLLRDRKSKVVYASRYVTRLPDIVAPCSADFSAIQRNTNLDLLQVLSSQNT